MNVVATSLFTVFLTTSACVTSGETERPGTRSNETGGTAGSGGSTNKGGNTQTGGSSNGSGGTGLTGNNAGSGGGDITHPKPELPACTSADTVCVDAIASWFGNAKGAYTIVHDDLCSYESHYAAAYDELGAVGLPAAFGAIAGSCSESWEKIAKLKEAGHEIINHSWSHVDLALEDSNLDQEIDESTALINEKLSDQKTLFFIFPYDSHNERAIDRLRSAGYLGARAGKRGGLNSADFSDNFRVAFDVFGPANSMYKKQGPCANENITSDGASETQGASEACRRFVLNQYVDDAIAQGGWAVRELHGVEDNSWEEVPLSDYQAHLAYVKSKVTEGVLWVAGPSDVLRYRRSRDYCVPALANGKLSFPTTSACTETATTISVILKPQAGSSGTLKVIQSGTALETKSLGDERFLVDLDPRKGEVELSVE